MAVVPPTAPRLSIRARGRFGALPDGRLTEQGLPQPLLDGETVFVLSGDWSLIGWPDFFAEWGYVTWVSSPEELEQYLPPYSKRQRSIGRHLRRIL
jgi:hypothetical protein